MEPPSPFVHRFDTNYVPNTSEITSIHQLTDKCQVLVDGVDDELEVRDQHRQALLAKRHAHVEYITKHRELISPVRRPYHDILVSIFLLLVSTAPPFAQALPSAVSISHVCRQWRDLAIVNPLVWAHIGIATPGYPVNPSSPSGELALENPQASKGLRHLEIDITYNQEGITGNGNWKSLQEKIDAQQACLTSLTAAMSASDLCRIHARWDKLVFLSVGSPHETSRLGPYQALNVLTITPNLERCVIQFSNGVSQSMHPSRRVVRIPKLRDLTIHGLLARPDPMVEWARRYGAQLTHFSFIYSHLTQSAFTSVLENLTNVVSLDLQAEDDLDITVQPHVHPQTGDQPKATHTALDSSLLQNFTPKLNESTAEIDVICPKLEILVCTLTEGHSEGTKGETVDFEDARRASGKKGGSIAWLGKVDVTFWVGPVGRMLGDL